MDKNQAVFGKPKYGLHGKALPNFFYKSSSDARLKSQPAHSGEDLSAVDVKPQTTVEWWKDQEGYDPNPRNISCRNFNRSKKYFAKPDKYYQNELTKDAPPVDDFKQGRKIKLKTNLNAEEIAIKPNAHTLADESPIYSFAQQQPSLKNSRQTKSARFSDVYAKPSQKAEDKKVVAQISYDAYYADVPLYSSFTQDKVFPKLPGDKAVNQQEYNLRSESNEYMLPEKVVKPSVPTFKKASSTHSKDGMVGRNFLKSQTSSIQSQNQTNVVQMVQSNKAPAKLTHTNSLFDRILKKNQ